VSAPYLTRSQFTWTLWGLRAQIALAVPLTLVRVIEAVGLQGVGAAFNRGESPDLGLLSTLDSVTRGLTYLNLLALLVTGVCFLIWWHHSVANLKAAGQPVSASPEWATAMWFVPFANLVLPLRIMKELAETAQDRRRAHQASLWWAAWIISNVVSLAATNSVRRLGDDPILQTTIAEGLYVFSKIMSVLAAMLLISLMRFVQQRQDAPTLPGVTAPAALAPEPFQPDTI
jgi:Domain of unknown function (DUF4328)